MEKFKLKEYDSKADNYHLNHRINDLKNIVEVQCSKGNYDYDAYMKGMANGLLLAWHTMMEPHDSPYLTIDSYYKFKANE